MTEVSSYSTEFASVLKACGRSTEDFELSPTDDSQVTVSNRRNGKAIQYDAKDPSWLMTVAMDLKMGKL